MDFDINIPILATIIDHDLSIPDNVANGSRASLNLPYFSPDVHFYLRRENDFWFAILDTVINDIRMEHFKMLLMQTPEILRAIEFPGGTVTLYFKTGVVWVKLFEIDRSGRFMPSGTASSA